MNTRKTFNGKRTKRAVHLPSAVLAAVVIVLGACAVAAWIFVAGLYIQDDRPSRQWRTDTLKNTSQVQPSDLHQGRFDK